LTVINKTQTTKSGIERSNRPVFYWNVILLVVALIGTFGYVFVSNRTVSGKYSIKLLNNEYSKSNAALELNGAQISEQINLDNLTAFARQKGMVDASEAASIFEESGVASVR
jgi:hypothetical protein